MSINCLAGAFVRFLVGLSSNHSNVLGKEIGLGEVRGRGRKGGGERGVWEEGGGIEGRREEWSREEWRRGMRGSGERKGEREGRVEKDGEGGKESLGSHSLEFNGG